MHTLVPIYFDEKKIVSYMDDTEYSISINLLRHSHHHASQTSLQQFKRTVLFVKAVE